MMTKLRPWTLHFRRALSSPGNLIAGAAAVLVSAVTWNPLPLILFGLGEPVWLYTATTSGRYARTLLEDRKAAVALDGQRALQWREHQLTALLATTPCGLWIRRGQLPDYPTTYHRLVAMRDQTAQLVAGRHDAANALEQDIVTRMDDMLRAYLMMVKERLLFHCSLAKLYPQLPEPPPAAPPLSLLDKVKRALVTPAASEPAPAPPWTHDTPFVSLDDARGEIRGKLRDFARETQRTPEHDDVYRPMIEALERRLAELELRGKNDRTIAAQLGVFPDQFEIILGKLASTQADVSEVIGDMKLLLEQTDDTVRFAEDTRTAERHTVVSN
jgi:hypothetical protein